MAQTTDRQETKQSQSWARTFLGDTPGRVAVRLILLSLLVGFLMSIFGISPQQVFRSVEGFVNSVFENGFDVFRDALGYVLTGAAIVVPIWLISRIFSASRRR